VVLLHGFSASAEITEAYTKIQAHSDREGYIVAIPNGSGSPLGWNAEFLNLSGSKCDDVAFVNRVVDRVGAEFTLDLKRIYLAGHSNGAMLSHLIASQSSSRFAAVACVAGTIGVPFEGRYRTIPDPKGPVSMLLIHGRKDSVVAFKKGDKALLKCVGVEDTAKWWAERDGCNLEATVEKDSSGSYETRTFRGGKNKTEVSLIIGNEGTHEFPGSFRYGRIEQTFGFNAVDKIWDFFKRHPKVD